MNKTYKGSYKPINPEKYRGNPANIIYRSSWERKCMHFFDTNPDVIWWQSEERAIAYRSPKTNGLHRYFPDFIVKIKNRKTGVIEIRVIEVKPKSQTKPPKKGANQQKYLSEVMTYGVNMAKWQAAKFFCEKRGWKFMVLTEDEIFGPKYKVKKTKGTNGKAT